MAVAITGKLARAAGRALMPSLWKSGLSPNQIYKALRFDWGFSWRRGVMFKDIREVTGLMRHQRQWVGVDNTQKASRFLFADIDIPAGYNYRVYANVNVYNDLTDEYESRIISFYTDSFNSPQEAMNEYLNFFNQTGSKANEFIVDYEILTAAHNRGAPW